MPQVAPFLKPPDPAAVPGDEAPAERDALNLPRLGVSGFWRRVGAFAFDFVLLWLVGHLVGRALLDVLMRNADAAWMIGGVATLAYFAVCFGPFGGGRTAGMALVGIRVVRLDGGVPGHGAAVVRALVLLPGIVTSRFITPLLDDSTFMGEQIATILTLWVTFAILTAQVLAIVFNPFKMGLHDYAAGTMVRPDIADLPTFGQMQERIGPLWRRYYMQPLVTGIATFAIVLGFAALANWPTRLDETTRERFDRERALLVEVGLGGTELTESGFTARIDPERDPKAPMPTHEQMFAELIDEETTAPLRFHLGIDHPGRLDLDAVQLEANARRYVESYHRDVFGRYKAEELFPGAKLSTKAFRRRPFEYRVVVHEYLILLMPLSRRTLATFDFTMPPLEPAAAPSAS